MVSDLRSTGAYVSFLLVECPGHHHSQYHSHPFLIQTQREETEAFGCNSDSTVV